MLQTGEQEQAHIVGHRERIALGVGRHQRSPRLIELQFRIGLDDFWTIARGEAAGEHAVGTPGQRIGDYWIGERKLAAGIERVGVLLHVAARLGEAVVGEHLLAAGDMRHQPLEHRPPRLIGIEAEVEEVLQVATALRLAEGDGAVDPAGEHVGRTGRIGGFVAQERDEVARCRKAQAHHLWILGLVDQFVDRTGIESLRPRDRDLVRPLEPEFEASGRHARVGLALAHGKLRMRRVEVGGGIAERRHNRILQIVENEFLARKPRHAGHRRHGNHLAPAPGT